jgi:hypothetical protein
MGLPGQLMDGDIRLGAHVHAGAALTVETLKTLLAAGAVGVELTLAGLQQHALGYYGGTHRLIAGGSDVHHGNQAQHHKDYHGYGCLHHGTPFN